MVIAYLGWQEPAARWPASADVELAQPLPRPTSRSGSRPTATSRTRTSRSALFNGFATFLDDLVRWLYHASSYWLTWAGHDRRSASSSCSASAAAARRDPGLAAFAAFAALGLWDESMQTFALMLAAVALSLLVGVPLGVLAGRSDRVRPADHAGARRDADHPGVRVPDAGRDPLLRRPGRRGVTTMIYAVPPAIRITALGIRGVPANTVEAATALGVDATAGAVRRCSCRSRAACCSCRSTRRSCSRSRWS